MNRKPSSTIASDTIKRPNTATARRSALIVALLAGACGQPPGDGLGTMQGAIASGTDAGVDAESNVVQVVVTLSDRVTKVFGSGFMIDNRTVITAAHLVYNSTDDHTVPPFFVSVVSKLNETASVISVVTHPTFVKGQLNGSVPQDGVFDIAVLKLRDKFQHITIPSRSYTGITDPQQFTSGAASYQIFGFGPFTDRGTDFEMRSFTPSSTKPGTTVANGPVLLEAQDNGGKHILAGDAGGAAISTQTGDVGNLVAIAMSPDVGDASKLIYLTQRLRDWIGFVSSSQNDTPRVCRIRHARSKGGFRDDYFMKNDTGNLSFHIEYAEKGKAPYDIQFNDQDGTPSCGTASSLAFIQMHDKVSAPASTVPAIIADTVNASGHTAVIALVDPSSADPILTNPSKSFSLPNKQFVGFENIKLDSFFGLLAIAKSGEANYFKVIPPAVDQLFDYEATPSQTFYGFPTVDGTDGKFVTVVGNDLATFPQPQASYVIELPPSATTLRVDIFDGDVGGKTILATAT